MLARDFSFEVPPRLIAQRPAARRGAERLLVLDRARAGNRHATMAELPALLPAGSLLDLTVAFAGTGVDAAAANEWFVAAAGAMPTLVAVTADPIVSSDVKNCPQSLLVDLQGTLRAGERMVKLLAWHETLGHARRILDVAACYAGVDGEAAEARPPAKEA